MNLNCSTCSVMAGFSPKLDRVAKNPSKGAKKHSEGTFDK